MKKLVILLLFAMPFVMDAQQVSTNFFKNTNILNAQILGPNPVCAGDTVEYSCSLKDTNLLYYWSIQNGEIITSNLDIVKVKWYSMVNGYVKVDVFTNKNIKIDSALSPIIRIYGKPYIPSIIYQNEFLITENYNPYLLCEWYLNGYHLDERDCKIIPVLPGIYQVRTISREYCKSELSAPFLFTDIVEFENKSVSVAPNPAMDFIEIELGSNHTLKGAVENIKIYNFLGEMVQNDIATPPGPLSRGGVTRIDVSGLVPGIYFVRVGDSVQRFVKY